MASVIILMGPTGAGKSVLAQRLAQEHGWAHISSGELLRQQPDHGAALVSGQLAPSKMVEKLVGEAIDHNGLEPVIVLDGFPRDLDEVTWLDAKLLQVRRNIQMVINLSVTQEVSAQRLMARGRTDDTAEALAAKWEEYERQTMPVVRFYEQRGLLTHVDGTNSVDDVYQSIKKVFNL